MSLGISVMTGVTGNEMILNDTTCTLLERRETQS